MANIVLLSDCSASEPVCMVHVWDCWVHTSTLLYIANYKICKLVVIFNPKTIDSLQVDEIVSYISAW